MIMDEQTIKTLASTRPPQSGKWKYRDIASANARISELETLIASITAPSPSPPAVPAPSPAETLEAQREEFGQLLARMTPIQRAQWFKNKANRSAAFHKFGGLPKKGKS